MLATRNVCLAAALLVGTGASALLAQSGGHSVEGTAGALTPVVPVPGAANDPFPRTLEDASGAKVRIGAAPQRIVSMDAKLDEYVYALVDAKLVVGVSEFGHSGKGSNVAKQAGEFHPIVANDAKAVVAAKPDLVLAALTTPAEKLAAIVAAGVPVYRVDTNFQTLQQVGGTVSLLGYVLGADKAAARASARLTATLYNAASKNNASGPRVALWNREDNTTSGAQTLHDDLLHTIGAVNVAGDAAGERRLGDETAAAEQIARWNPDWIVVTAEAGQAEAARAAVMKHAAIAGTPAGMAGHIVVVELKTYLSQSTLAGDFAAELATAIYP